MLGYGRYSMLSNILNILPTHFFNISEIIHFMQVAFVFNFLEIPGDKIHQIFMLYSEFYLLVDHIFTSHL